MKVSIVIPIYNISQYLPDCLASCINQTYKDIEIICVNDGSTDESKSIIEHFQSIDNRIILVDKKNGGLPSAREAGVGVITGEYLFHLDGDDNIPLNTISDLVEGALKNDSDIVIGDYQTIYEDNSNFYTNSGIKTNLSSVEYANYILNRGLFNIWGKLIRTSLYRDNDIKFPHNISIAEDLVQTFQLAHYAKRVSPYHTCCYNYFIRSSSMSKTNNEVGSLTDRAIYAICFINDFYHTHFVPDIEISLKNYISDFIYTYLCSRYPVSLREVELNLLLKEVDADVIAKISNSKKRFLMSVAKKNLNLAKHIVSFHSSIKKIWK